MGNNASNLIKNEITKIWKELKKTSSKEDLNKLREEMKKTRIEFKNGLKKYATKEDLENNVKDLINFIQFVNNQTKKELGEEMQSMKKELKEEIVQFKDDILTEIIKLREDIAVVVGYRDQIEDHEKRITKLEKPSKHN